MCIKLDTWQKVALRHWISYRKVDTGHAIHDDEDVRIGELGKAVVQADREHKHQHLQVEVEGGPGGRLMFRDRGDDRDVVLGIGGVQQGVEAAGPGRDLACGCEDTTNGGHTDSSDRNHNFEQQLEVLSWHARTDIVNKGMDLAKAEYSKGLKREWKKMGDTSEQREEYCVL